MTSTRVFTKTNNVLKTRTARITCRHDSNQPLKALLSTHQTGTTPSTLPDQVLSSLPRGRAQEKNERLESKPSTRDPKASSEKTVVRPDHSKRSSRIYPVRKQFIYESYVDLFTSNQVCLLFKHHALSSRQWNSIRGQVKNLSSPVASSPSFGEFKYTEEHEAARLKQQVPQIQVLRTKMLLPVLIKLLKESKIEKGIYNSLVYSQRPSPTKPGQDPKTQTFQRGPTHLTGSLFAITQPKFEPHQIKKVLNILNAYSTPPEEPKKPAQGESQKSTPKVQFLIGLIDQSTICKDMNQLKKLSDLDSLESLRSQIISLLNLPVQNLLFNLNFARASNLIFTLNSHIKTQQLLAPPPTPPSVDQSSDPHSPS